MELEEIVYKLVGNITPIGETLKDDESFENLKVMCNLIEKLLGDIHYIAYSNRNSGQYSINRSVNYIDKFISTVTTK